MPLSPGEKIGNYFLVEPIGEGKTARVWLARHINGSSPREVAIKFFKSSNSDTMARIKLEFETLRTVRHPCIPRVHGDGIGSYRGFPYIVMDYAGRKTLADRIAREGCIPVDQALRIAKQIAGALDACHARGVVHRDVKPLNIRISHGDRGDHAMLVDFGIAKKDDLKLTIDGNIFGTAYYMSPEQVKAERLDGKSDQYSLAISLWEMLTGRVTFEGKTAWEVVYKHVHDPPGPLRIPGLDYGDPRYARIDSALRKALSKERDARFSSCTEFIRAMTVEEPSQSVMVEVCAASGLLPGPYCREKRAVPASRVPPRTGTCTKCKPPGPVEVKVCPVSGLLPGPHCRSKLRRYAPDKVPVDVCDRCGRQPTVVSVRLCEKTGLRAGWGCQRKVVREFARDKVPPPCRECKFPWPFLLAPVGPVMLLLIVIAAMVSNSPVPVEFKVTPPTADARIEWCKLSGSRWSGPEKNKELRLQKDRYKFRVSAPGYVTQAVKVDVTLPKDAGKPLEIPVTLRPDTVSPLLEQSQEAVKQGDIARGVTLFKKAVNLIRTSGIGDPESLATTRRCLLNEAQYLLKQRLYLQAARLYEDLWNSRDVVAGARSKRQYAYALQAAESYHLLAKEQLPHDASLSGNGKKYLDLADKMAKAALANGADTKDVEKLRYMIGDTASIYFPPHIAQKIGLHKT